MDTPINNISLVIFDTLKLKKMVDILNIAEVMMTQFTDVYDHQAFL